MENNKKIVVIGAGFGGLGSAILMAKKGYDVTVVEKNDKPGGRANLLEANGYKRDMGPSRYLMPDAFEKYFAAIGENISDHFELQKLSPSYRVFFKSEKTQGDKSDNSDSITKSQMIDIYSDIDKAAETFESIELGAGEQLRKYLKSAEYQYNIAMNQFVYKNFDSIWDFMDPKMGIEGLKLNIFTTLYNYVSKFVKDERLKKILMYPSVFLGTSPYKTPALFNIMSHVDFNQGVFYPKGGIHEIIKSLEKIAIKAGVKFVYNSKVEKIDVVEGKAKGIYIKNKNPARGLNSSNSGSLTNDQLINTYILSQEQGSSELNREDYDEVYKKHIWGDNQLYYFGDHHTPDYDHPQYEEINEFAEDFYQKNKGKNNIILVENAKGIDKQRILDTERASCTQALVRISEKYNIPFESPEPTKIEYIDYLKSMGIEDKYILYDRFLVIITRRHRGEKDKTIEEFLQWFYGEDTSIKYICGEMYSLELLKKTYKDIYNKEIDFDNIDEFRSEASPEGDSRSNYTSYLGGNYRDMCITKTVLEYLDKGYNIFIGFGRFHLSQQWNIYDKYFEQQIVKSDKVPEGGNSTSINNNIYIPADIIISNADMHHTETKLLEPKYQSYPESYRAKKVISPSGFILYLGVDGKLPQLQHHTLIFNHDWKKGFSEVFQNPIRPTDPSYYICNPSKTDPSTAPEGKENLFLLVPIAPGLEYSDDILAKYADFMIDDISRACDIPDLRSRIQFQQTFSLPQFESYYNAYKGTALGLAHTFFQSAIRRPANYSKKASGLYYAGGYTTPGIGMPMCLISAMMVADRISKNDK